MRIYNAHLPASLVPLREILHLTGIGSLPRLISCDQESKSRVERAMGIEPTAQAWEAWVLPLYDARYSIDSSRVPRGLQTLASCDGYRYAGIPRRQRANPITPARYRMPLASEHRLIPPIALLPMCPPKGGSNRATLVGVRSIMDWRSISCKRLPGTGVDGGGVLGQYAN